MFKYLLNFFVISIVYHFDATKLTVNATQKTETELSEACVAPSTLPKAISSSDRLENIRNIITQYPDLKMTTVIPQLIDLWNRDIDFVYSDLKDNHKRNSQVLTDVLSALDVVDQVVQQNQNSISFGLINLMWFISTLFLSHDHNSQSPYHLGKYWPEIFDSQGFNAINFRNILIEILEKTKETRQEIKDFILVDFILDFNSLIQKIIKNQKTIKDLILCIAYEDFNFLPERVLVIPQVSKTGLTSIIDENHGLFFEHNNHIYSFAFLGIATHERIVFDGEKTQPPSELWLHDRDHFIKFFPFLPNHISLKNFSGDTLQKLNSEKIINETFESMRKFIHELKKEQAIEKPSVQFALHYLFHEGVVSGPFNFMKKIENIKEKEFNSVNYIAEKRKVNNNGGIREQLKITEKIREINKTIFGRLKLNIDNGESYFASMTCDADLSSSDEETIFLNLNIGFSDYAFPLRLFMTLIQDYDSLHKKEDKIIKKTPVSGSNMTLIQDYDSLSDYEKYFRNLMACLTRDRRSVIQMDGNEKYEAAQKIYNLFLDGFKTIQKSLMNSTNVSDSDLIQKPNA